MHIPVHEIPFWSSEVDALRAVITDPDRAGVIVLGAPGAGKTSLVRVALQDGAGPAPLTLQCGAALVDVAYGALSPFLTELEDIRGPADVLGAVQEHLDSLAPSESPSVRPRPVIVVEDCQFLDAASAFVLALLAQNREAVLLATSVGLRGGSGLGALVDTGLLATVVMPPLRAAQTRALCTTLVGGSPTDGAVSTILRMTGGSPSLVTAFVASAVDQGIVVRPDGAQARPGALWTLLRPAPSVDERLIRVVETLRSGLTDQQQVAVSMLALAGRMSGTQLRAVAGDQAKDLAEAHVTSGTEDAMVTLSAELYAEVLRTITPPGRGAELLAQWESAGGTSLRPPPPHSVAWAADNDLPVSEEDRLAAGYEHLAAGDIAAAWYLVGRPAGSGTERLVALRAEVMLAAARTWSGRTDLVQVADTTTDQQMVSEALAVLAMDLVHRGVEATPTPALRTVWLEHRDRARAQDRALPAVAGAAAEWWDALDRLDVAEDASRLLDLSAGLAADPTTHPALRCLAHWLRRRLLFRQGRLVEAVEAATSAYAEASRSSRMSALMGGHAMVYLVKSLLTVGDLEAAEQVLADQRAASAHRWHRWAGTVGALRGILEAARGRPGQARDTLRGAALDLQQWDPVQLRPLVEAMRGLVATAADGVHAVDGRSLADRLRAGDRRGSTDQWLFALAVADVVDGLRQAETPHGPPVWQRVVDDPELHPYPAVRWAVLLVASASRSADDDNDELMKRLHQASTQVDGPRAALVGLASDPAIASDWVRLAQVAGTARAAGDLGLAADIWARVVQLHHRTNDLRRRGEALRHLQDLVRVLRGVPSRFVRAALDLGALSAREREIVELAQEGHRTADIARMLVVSPRTVEGHLYRVFTKLGISDRTELRSIRL